ncbi:cell wall metabolism sensor histidine kinase WalK [Acidaminobacter sp. JC074]|uniref:two-component system histidine kinase PnpS n=1 Tax=Acidaminobacter sp. JC074 TaxID=2530199 RepID=UPI001F0E61FA|nr:cell wall metabolism sensor histidine kinase WalK [Acidaminobacter sp. JC074]
MKNIKQKFILIFVLLVSLGVVISGILSIGLLKSNYEEGVKENLIENATIIRYFIESENDMVVVDDFLRHLDAEVMNNQMETRITLINHSGVVLVDTAISESELDNHKERPEIKEAFDGKIGVSKRYSDSVDKDMYYVAMPVESSDFAVVRLSIPLRNLTEYTDQIVGNIVIAALVGVVLATLVGIRFLNMFTGPLFALTEATESISKGNYGEQVFVSSDDEIGQLAKSFNMMSTELDKRIVELHESNNTNHAILKSMINGVIAIDNENRIMFINKAAQEMFSLDEKALKGMDVVDSFKNHILSDLFDSDFDIYGNIKTELDLDIDQPKVFRVFSNVIRDRDFNNNIGLLLSFVDITQMRQLENMRKEFVANVSHELKTPLTSIQGFIETLKEGAADKKEVRDKFIDIIDIEAKRLKHLIDDILVLSDIEKSTGDHHETEVSPNQVVEEISNMMGQIAGKKEITVNYNLPENMAPILANKVWLKQMLINLIDNGIKYTPEGGQVDVQFADMLDHNLIIVKDNGIGIAPEHLDRLFERFYRVDKARSKKEGGTGLGLAIVKHIVLSMNGDIRVKSELDKGTEFTIRIPKKF